MGSKSGGGGSAPDPFQTAQAQAALNRQAALDSMRFNQINQVTPWTSRYWTGDIGSPNRTQHTAYNPILQSIIFGGNNKGGQNAIPPGMAGGGIEDPLLGANSPFAPKQQEPDYHESGDPGDFGVDAGSYDTFGQFANALKRGFRTGNWGMGGDPGYSGLDADAAAQAAMDDMAGHMSGLDEPGGYSGTGYGTDFSGLGIDDDVGFDDGGYDDGFDGGYSDDDFGGFQQGGFTGYGSDGVLQPSNPAGIVHEGEMVIPAPMVHAMMPMKKKRQPNPMTTVQGQQQGGLAAILAGG